MWPVRDFDGKPLNGWERRRNDSGIPYYLHHDGKHTQWDHPLLTNINAEILNCNSVKYVAYRTASKCRIFQKVTQMHKVKLPTIISQFDQHGFRGCQSVNLINSEELENLLCDIYTSTMKDQMSTSNARTIAEVAANIFMNIYDRNRLGAIRVSSAKIILTLFCSAKLQEKYKYLFHQFADYNNCISRIKLIEILQDVSRIPEYLSESPSFGSQFVELTAETCCKADSYTLGVTEEAFMSWLLREPQTLVWISTMYRLSASETSVHDFKCNVCKVFPIQGMRYRCLRCLQFDMCQNCFFTGQSSKRHKLYHPIQEYCYRVTSTSKEGTKAFMTTIKNMFSKKTASNMKQRYLPISQTTTNNIETASTNQIFDDDVASHCPSEQMIDNYETPLDSRTVYYESLQRNESKLNPQNQKELEELNRCLENENRQLKAEVENFRNATTRNIEITELHEQSQQNLDLNPNLELECKLDRLRTLLSRLQTIYPHGETLDLDQNMPPPPRYESTPVRHVGSHQHFNLNTPIDPRHNCPISNVPSIQSTPQHNLPVYETSPRWERRFGDLPEFARRSLPLNSFHRSYPSGFNQPSTSYTQRASARAILQNRVCNKENSIPLELQSSLASYSSIESSTGYYVEDYVTEDINNISNNRHVDILVDKTSTGLSRIQNELESIIRQLEAIYPGCSAQSSMVSGNVSDKYRIMATANEIETMLRDLVSKVAMTNTDLSVNVTENIPCIV